MSQKIPGDNDIYCAAIARRLGVSVEAYKDTLDKENPFADPQFLSEKKKTTMNEFVAAQPDVYEMR